MHEKSKVVKFSDIAWVPATPPTDSGPPLLPLLQLPPESKRVKVNAKGAEDESALLDKLQSLAAELGAHMDEDTDCGGEIVGGESVGEHGGGDARSALEAGGEWLMDVRIHDGMEDTATGTALR
jgi:hypothetical protein